MSDIVRVKASEIRKRPRAAITPWWLGLVVTLGGVAFGLNSAFQWWPEAYARWRGWPEPERIFGPGGSAGDFVLAWVWGLLVGGFIAWLQWRGGVKRLALWAALDRPAGSLRNNPQRGFYWLLGGLALYFAAFLVAQRVVPLHAKDCYLWGVCVGLLALVPLYHRAWELAWHVVRQGEGKRKR